MDNQLLKEHHKATITEAISIISNLDKTKDLSTYSNNEQLILRYADTIVTLSQTGQQLLQICSRLEATNNKLLEDQKQEEVTYKQKFAALMDLVELKLDADKIENLAMEKKDDRNEDSGAKRTPVKPKAKKKPTKKKLSNVKLTDIADERAGVSETPSTEQHKDESHTQEPSEA